MPGAATTDVRQWLREHGEDVKERGAIPADLRARYDEAHSGPGVVAGEVIDDGALFAGGVTEADFPPADDPGPASPAGPGEDQPKTARERRPRRVRPAAAKGGMRERIFGGKAAGPAKPKARPGPRVSLSDWAEETWSDLAWLAAPIPPLAKILTIQAPYAGVVFDEQVRGTVIDSALQPVAKYSGAFRALNGLAGPPVYVGMICAMGQRVQVAGPDGLPLFEADGTPVTVFDQRTQMLMQGLRYSLLQMTKISELNAEQIRERTESSTERMRVVDQIIADLFNLPAPGSAPAAPPRSGAAGADYTANGFQYPPAPTMDDTGADPGRL
jgi:hypothetical protein